MFLVLRYPVSYPRNVLFLANFPASLVISPFAAVFSLWDRDPESPMVLGRLESTSHVWDGDVHSFENMQEIAQSRQLDMFVT